MVYNTKPSSCLILMSEEKQMKQKAVQNLKRG